MSSLILLNVIHIQRRPLSISTNALW